MTQVVDLDTPCLQWTRTDPWCNPDEMKPTIEDAWEKRSDVEASYTGIRLYVILFGPGLFSK